MSSDRTSMPIRTMAVGAPISQSSNVISSFGYTHAQSLPFLGKTVQAYEGLTPSFN